MTNRTRGKRETFLLSGIRICITRYLWYWEQKNDSIAEKTHQSLLVTT